MYVITSLDENLLINKFKKASIINSTISLTESEERSLEANMPVTRFGIMLYKQNLEKVTNPNDENSSVPNIVMERINSKFFNLEDKARCLSDAFELKYNVLFYGKGGYGKSELTVFFFEVLYELGIIDEKPFVFSLSEGTTDDELFGGSNIKTLQETGEIKYNIENSFMNHKYVIFEEIFDAHPQTLLSLKDILTSKRFRKGSQNEPIRTEMVVGLTNKSKTDFGTDTSKRALLDRFAYSMLFEWENPTINDYIGLFNKVAPTLDPAVEAEYSKLADVVSTYNRQYNNNHISPRMCIAMLKTHLSGKTLKYIEGIDANALALYAKKVENNKGLSNVEIATNIRKNLVKVMEDFKVGPTTFVNSNITTLFQAEYMLHRLKGGTPDNFVPKEAIRIEGPFVGQDDDFKDYLKDTEKELEDLINAETDEVDKELITLELAYVQLVTTEI